MSTLSVQWDRRAVQSQRRAAQLAGDVATAELAIATLTEALRREQVAHAKTAKTVLGLGVTVDEMRALLTQRQAPPPPQIPPPQPILPTDIAGKVAVADVVFKHMEARMPDDVDAVLHELIWRNARGDRPALLAPEEFVVEKVPYVFPVAPPFPPTYPMKPIRDRLPGEPGPKPGTEWRRCSECNVMHYCKVQVEGTLCFNCGNGGFTAERERY